MSAKKLYIIGNSYMDPIWPWRLKEGRSTWLNTCRSVVRILQKYMMLRFARSSVACYRWLKERDPELFQAIALLIDAGRWKAVGGWEEQSDTVITPAAALLRQSRFDREYFRRKFGREISITYCVDSFGQNCGLLPPLAVRSFRRYVWICQGRTEKKMPHQFCLKGDDGTAEVTAFRVLGEYTTANCRNREQLFARIEYLLENGDEHQSFFFVIGDHGGGINEDQLRWLLLAAERYPLEFSTLEHYFEVIEAGKLSVVSEELFHHAPGCYSSVEPIKNWMADCGELQRELWWFDLPSERVTPVCQSRLLGADHIELTAASDGTKFHRAAWNLEPDVVIPLGQRRRDNGVIEWELWKSSGKRVPFQLRYGSSVIASRRWKETICNC